MTFAKYEGHWLNFGKGLEVFVAYTPVYITSGFDAPLDLETEKEIEMTEQTQVVVNTDGKTKIQPRL